MIALIVGALLASASLVFVMWPLFAPPRGSAAPRRRPAAARGNTRDSAVRALREIEFDRATGKLADADYDTLKATYTERALAELRASDNAALTAAALAAATPGVAPSADLVEALISRAREAAQTCGACQTVCPEPDAVYCSTCGHYLPEKCTKCGAAVGESGARFCASCGWTLAA